MKSGAIAKIDSEFKLIVAIIVFRSQQFHSKGVSNMAVMKFFRKIFKKDGPKPSVEYVRDDGAEPEASLYQADRGLKRFREIDNEIDMSRRSDLEDYARDINVSKESIEKWISSGLLMPEELKVAEKLVKIMRKHDE